MSGNREADGNNSGDIYGAFKADAKIDNVSVGGSLIGGDGILSGVIGGVPVTSAEEGPTARSISSS